MEQKFEQLLEQLGEMREVDPPAFLLTRIAQAVKKREVDKVFPIGRAWAIAAGLTTILIINGWLIYRNTSNYKTESASTTLYQVYNNNNIYQ